MSTNFDESKHPRISNGTFTDKPQSAPEVSLGATGGVAEVGERLQAAISRYHHAKDDLGSVTSYIDNAIPEGAAHLELILADEPDEEYFTVARAVGANGDEVEIDEATLSNINDQLYLLGLTAREHTTENGATVTWARPADADPALAERILAGTSPTVAEYSEMSEAIESLTKAYITHPDALPARVATVEFEYSDQGPHIFASSYRDADGKPVDIFSDNHGLSAAEVELVESFDLNTTNLRNLSAVVEAFGDKATIEANHYAKGELRSVTVRLH